MSTENNMDAFKAKQMKNLLKRLKTCKAPFFHNTTQFLKLDEEERFIKAVNAMGYKTELVGNRKYRFYIPGY